MNIVTMSRAGAAVRLTLVSLIAFGTTLLTLGDGRPDHVLAWEDWTRAALAALYVAYNYMSKAWAASSADSPPAVSPSSLAYFGLAPNSAAPPAPAPVSGPPGAAQGHPEAAGFADAPPPAPFDPNKTIIPGSAAPTGEM